MKKMLSGTNIKVHSWLIQELSIHAVVSKISVGGNKLYESAIELIVWTEMCFSEVLKNSLFHV